MAPTGSSVVAPRLLYSCIAYKTTVLAEHASPSAGPHASSLAAAVLPKISHEKDQKLTYTHGPDLVHYIASADSASRKSMKGSSGENDRDCGLTFLVVAHAELGRRIPFNYLTEIRRRFLDVFGGEHPPLSKSNKNLKDSSDAKDYFSTLPPYGAASFNATLRNLTATYNKSNNSNANSNTSATAAAAAAAAADSDGTYKPDALTTARAELADARVVMTDNIERVLDRGERIDLLVNQTDRLGGSARDFRVRSRDLRRRMWWKNVKLMVLVTVVMVFLAYLLVGMGCGLPGWSRCLGH